MAKTDLRINPAHITLLIPYDKQVSKQYKLVKPTHKRTWRGLYKHTDAYVWDKIGRYKIKLDKVNTDKFIVSDDHVYIKTSIKIFFSDDSSIMIYFDTEKEKEDVLFDLSNEANLKPVMAY